MNYYPIEHRSNRGKFVMVVYSFLLLISTIFSGLNFNMFYWNEMEIIPKFYAENSTRIYGLNLMGYSLIDPVDLDSKSAFITNRNITWWTDEYIKCAGSLSFYTCSYIFLLFSIVTLFFYRFGNCKDDRSCELDESYWVTIKIFIIFTFILDLVSVSMWTKCPEDFVSSLSISSTERVIVYYTNVFFVRCILSISSLFSICLCKK